jgi:Rad3-related DNA helicase
MDRGVDLPDDLCKCQVIAKVPYPNLGDKQVSARLHNTKDGKLWYAAETARTIVQMCGRGVRHANDECVVYVLDSSFLRWYAQWQLLLPVWFRQAIRIERG